MKRLICASVLLLYVYMASAQVQLMGRVYDASTEKPLPHATLALKSSGRVYRSDNGGHFVLTLSGRDTARVTSTGYIPADIVLTDSMGAVTVALQRQALDLEEIEINTGYYRIAREQMTGSAAHLDNRTLNRTVGANLLERLEGMLPGVQFVNPNGNAAADIRVRGLSTIESDESPLIVLDNFPYAGNLTDIDPNSIEDITVLKDAAAAAIWGARAGNGVIVITSKKARGMGRTGITFSTNTAIHDRPDLYYSPRWLPSATVMEIEQERYDLGQYVFSPEDINPYYVELLHSYGQGTLDEAVFLSEQHRLRHVDTRSEALKYLYQNPVNRQYALQVSRRQDSFGMMLSAAHNRARGELIGNSDRRTNINLSGDIDLLSRLSLHTALAFTEAAGRSSGVPFDMLGVTGFGVSPYLQLQDDDGRAMGYARSVSTAYALEAREEGLLDWLYYPIEETKNVVGESQRREFRMGNRLRIGMAPGMDLSLMHQYIFGEVQGSTYRDEESFYVRDLVNSLTQPDGKKVIPHNGILGKSGQRHNHSHRARAQISYAKMFGQGMHDLNTLAGMDIGQAVAEGFPGSVLYNYDEDYLTGEYLYNYNQFYTRRPSGSMKIPYSLGTRSRFTDRDLSYYLNGTYSYGQRYMLSSSVRWDASNLFGVKTNQKGVPLWSVGGAWRMSREPFLARVEWLDNLKLRATYGVMGNVNKTVTHYPTVGYGTHATTGLTTGALMSVGNPSLRWEKVLTRNYALDAAVRLGRHRISSSVEWYAKDGRDLIGDDFMDPTTGVTDSYKINYAGIRSEGWDMQISARWRFGKFLWHNSLNGSWVSNEVTEYNTNEVTGISFYFRSAPPLVVGASRDIMYAIPWHGLSPDDGLPILYMDGEETKDYRKYYNEYLTYDHLSRSALKVPTHYGSLRNGLEWAGIELDFMLTWKWNHAFRRQSMAPSDEFRAQYHEDYYRRWQKAGDEKNTDVPVKLSPGEQNDINGYAASIYRDSDILIEPGDHIRLHEVNLGFNLPAPFLKKTGLSGIRLSAHAKNLGILWKATDGRLDPDYADARYPIPSSYLFGIQVKF